MTAIAPITTDAPIDEALALAERGIPVFPCRTDKRPLTDNGFHDATTDADTVRGWWKRWPHALVAVPTGEASGFDVLDVDPDGDSWATEHAEVLMAAGRIHHSPRGRHYLFLHADGVRNSAGKIAPGIDVRGEGGYVVWWPAHGHEICGEIEEVGPAPEALAAQITASQAAQKPEGAAVADVIPEGQRDSALTSLAGTLRRRGLTADEIAATLRMVNEARCQPPVAESDIQRIANSVARYEAGDPITTGEDEPDASIWTHPLSAGELLATRPEPIAWLVRQRIQLGRGVLLTGIGGSSKTRLLYQLAIGSCVGRVPWDWQIEHTGRAMLILTEDTVDDVHRTLYHTCEALDLSDDERQRVGDGVILHALAGKDVRLLAQIDGRDLVKTALFESLVEAINATGNIVFVGLDPALSLTGGDEMDQGHQRMLGKMADDLAVRTGAATCLVSHATKASASSNELGSHNSRGGGAITDAVRGEFAMRTMTTQEAASAGIEDIEERKRLKQLVATKGNHIPPNAFVPIWLRAGDHGVLTEAQVTMQSRHDRGMTDRDAAALDVLRTMMKDHTPNLSQWRAECHRQGVITGATEEAVKKTMDRVKDSLRRHGMIQQGFGRGVWVPTECEEDLSGVNPS